MNPPPGFYRRLRGQRVGLMVALALLLGFALVGGFSLAILAGDAWDARWSWQEANAFRALIALSLAFAAGGAAGVVAIVTLRPGLVDLARRVESRHPALRESLSTAVEIQQIHGGPRNKLEAALFRAAEAESEPLNFRAATMPPWLRPARAVAVVVAATVLSQWAWQSTLPRKARCYLYDWAHGGPTGLQVTPGPVDAPRGSDLAVGARILRWQREAAIEQRHVDGHIERYPMAAVGPDDFAFTWYALEDSFTYRVVTPSLSSPWYEITVYEPPEINAVAIAMEPPDYTGEEPLTFGQLMDLYAPEGSAVAFDLDLPPGVDATLRLGEASLAANGGHVSFTATTSADYQFYLRNAEGREAVTPRYELAVRPDDPPTVAVIDPGRDTQARLEDMVPLEIYAADDYGLASIEVELSVSGLPRAPLEAWTAPAESPLEITTLPVLEIAKLGVEFGDVITYFARATDIREPEPRVGRSEVYFIEIVEQPGAPEQENSGGSGEGGEREKDLDLRAYITELKRLVRLAYRVDAETGRRRELGSQELGADLGKLATEAQGVLSEIGGTLGQIEEGAPYELFLDAIYRMVDAEAAANANAPDDAIPPMQESMSLLIRLEKYLQALFPPQPSSGGGGGGSQAQTSGAQSEAAEEGSAEAEGMSVAEMKAALERLNHLADEQSAMNRRFERARGELGQAEREDLQAQQDTVATGARELAHELERLREGQNVREALRAAESDMQQAGSAVGQGDARRAGRAGDRARDSLTGAAALLEERMRAAATADIAALAQRAEQLAQGQGAAATDSRGAATTGADTERQEALQEQQRELNDQWAEARHDMDELAGELASVFPEAAKALSEAARDAHADKVDREMARAANALLYGRFERAAGSQDQAATKLGELAQRLDAAAGTLPGLSPAEMRELIQRVNEARRQLAARESESSGQGESEGSTGSEGESGKSGQGSGEESSESDARAEAQLGRLGESLSQAGRALGDTDLTRLGAELSAPQAGEGAGGGVTPARALDAAAGILRDYLRRELGDQRLRLNREGGPPPEQYRELVEEYFRDLAEEPNP